MDMLTGLWVGQAILVIGAGCVTALGCYLSVQDKKKKAAQQTNNAASF